MCEVITRLLNSQQVRATGLCGLRRSGGFVSCLRAYTPNELLAMGREVAPDYKWETGKREVVLPRVKLTLTYLVGEPTRARTP